MLFPEFEPTLGITTGTIQFQFENNNSEKQGVCYGQLGNSTLVTACNVPGSERYAPRILMINTKYLRHERWSFCCHPYSHLAKCVEQNTRTIKIVWEKLTEASQSERFGNHSTDLSLQGHSAYEDITSSQNLLWEDSCFNLLNPVFNQTYLASLFLFIWYLFQSPSPKQSILARPKLCLILDKQKVNVCWLNERHLHDA